MNAFTQQGDVEADGYVSDPLHVPNGDADTCWSRVNLGEFIVGVPTPLTWNLWDHGTRLSGPEIYYRMGLATGQERRHADDSQTITTVLFGWPVCNVDAMRHFIDRAGKEAGDSFERNMLGELSNRPKTTTTPKTRRGISGIKTTYMLLTYPKLLERTVSETRDWWRDSVQRCNSASLKQAKAIVADAFARYPNVCVVAGSGGTVGGQIIFSLLEKALPTGKEKLLPKIVSGGDNLAEARMLAALWDVSEGKLSLTDFLDEYGFYGSDVGECLNRSWRENPNALTPIIENYRSSDGALDPSKRHQERVKMRASALDELRAAAGTFRFSWIGVLLSYAEKMTQWREDGKTCTLRVHDVVRAGARRVGELLVADGDLDNPNDVFFLSQAEIEAAPFPNLRETVLFRQAKRSFYEEIDMPDAFVGMPNVKFRSHGQDVETLDDVTAENISGIGVSPGTIIGRARVVLDPADCGDFERGDILVCRNTDPSWAPLFTLAGGIVTDMGGMLSHGAIIARELGVPCVVNTRTGTRSLSDRQRIHIDGTTGKIEVLP